MNTYNYSVISKEKRNYLETLFDKYMDDKNTIFFQDFKDIINKSKLLEKEKVGKLIDQIGKDIRDKLMSTTESQIKISKILL
jgi:hypothetical protein